MEMRFDWDPNIHGHATLTSVDRLGSIHPTTHGTQTTHHHTNTISKKQTHPPTHTHTPHNAPKQSPSRSGLRCLPGGCASPAPRWSVVRYKPPRTPSRARAGAGPALIVCVFGGKSGVRGGFVGAWICCLFFSFVCAWGGWS